MMNKTEPRELILGFAHRFVPSRAQEKTSRRSTLTLLLLHGTGGNEDDLIPLGHQLAPGSAFLGVRGKVMEDGMPRFFRRFSEGVFDIEDLKLRTGELADFVTSASNQYGFDLKTLAAVGYSNGANIAASILLLRPRVLSGAVLFRAMLPLVPEKLPNLSGKPILLSAGISDPIVPRAQVEKLKELLQGFRASVTLNWAPTDHSLIEEEIRKAKNFLQMHFA